MDEAVYTIAGGEISVWLDGGIMLKVHEPFGDPVELGEGQALELADLLVRLVRDQA